MPLVLLQAVSGLRPAALEQSVVRWCKVLPGQSVASNYGLPLINDGLLGVWGMLLWAIWHSR